MTFSFSVFLYTSQKSFRKNSDSGTQSSIEWPEMVTAEHDRHPHTPAATVGTHRLQRKVRLRGPALATIPHLAHGSELAQGAFSYNEMKW